MKLYVGYNMCYMNVVRLMCDFICIGWIGEVKVIWCCYFVGVGGDFYFKDWYVMCEYGIGLLLQKVVYDIDVMYWFVGFYIIDVVGMGGLIFYDQIIDCCDYFDEFMGDWYLLDNWLLLFQKGFNLVIDVEDLLMVFMCMELGVYVFYQQCYYMLDYWCNYIVIGIEGCIENFGDGEGGVIWLWNMCIYYNVEGDEIFLIIGDVNGYGDVDVFIVIEFFNFVCNGICIDMFLLGVWYVVVVGIEVIEFLWSGLMLRMVLFLDVEFVEYFNNNQVK